MNFYDVPYHIIPNDEECVINASQIGKRIGEAPSTIRTWANQYEEYLYIKKVNGRFVYTEKSVIQFEFIKKLVSTITKSKLIVEGGIWEKWQLEEVVKVIEAKTKEKMTEIYKISEKDYKICEKNNKWHWNWEWIQDI